METNTHNKSETENAPMEVMDLANFLKEKRMASGISQKDVAKKLGYTTSQFISNWERGISQPPMTALKILAELYKVDSNDMFQVLLTTTIKQVEISLKRKFYSTN